MKLHADLVTNELIFSFHQQCFQLTGALKAAAIRKFASSIDGLSLCLVPPLSKDIIVVQPKSQWVDHVMAVRTHGIGPVNGQLLSKRTWLGLMLGFFKWRNIGRWWRRWRT